MVEFPRDGLHDLIDIDHAFLKLLFVPRLNLVEERGEAPDRLFRIAGVSVAVGELLSAFDRSPRGPIVGELVEIDLLVLRDGAGPVSGVVATVGEVELGDHAAQVPLNSPGEPVDGPRPVTFGVLAAGG